MAGKIILILLLAIEILVVGCTLNEDNVSDTTPTNRTLTPNRELQETSQSTEEVARLLTITPSPKTITQSTEITQPTNQDAFVQTPTPAVTLYPTPQSVPLFSSPLVAFHAQNQETEKSAIFLFDTETASSRQFSLDMYGGSVLAFQWATNPCHLNVTMSTAEDVQFIRLNLSGMLQEKYDLHLPYETEDGLMLGGWRVSPDGKWIAYLVKHGQEGLVYSEFQDMEVIENKFSGADPFRLTNNGWTLEAVWSPDSQKLAFTDFDSNGVPQLFLSTPSGQARTQLTHLTEQIERIVGIRWSPNGESLVFNVYYVADPLESGASSLWSIASNGSTLQKAEIGELIVRQPAWWSEDSQSYTARIEDWQAGSSEGRQGEEIVWIDPQNGSVVHRFVPSEHDITFEHVFPVGGNQKVGFLGSVYKIYDRGSGLVDERGSSPFGPTYPLTLTPIIGPYDFTNEAHCRSS